MEEQLSRLLKEYHKLFSLGKGDQGETDLIELHIDTGDTATTEVPSVLSSLCSEG